MAKSVALLVDDVFPERLVRQWVLSEPFPLRFLFANQPVVMGQVLGIVYRAIATYLCHRAGFKAKDAQTGAVTLIQRFGWSGIPAALNLNIYFHVLFLDGAYIQRPDGKLRFRQIAPPTSQQLKVLLHRITHRVAALLERRGRQGRDYWSAMPRTATSPWPALTKTMRAPCRTCMVIQLPTGLHWGRSGGKKVFSLQTLPLHTAQHRSARLAKAAGFSLHAGASAQADQRDKLERSGGDPLCRYISRPAVSDKRLSLTANGQVRYQLKTPYRDGRTHVIFNPLDFLGRLAALALRGPAPPSSEPHAVPWPVCAGRPSAQ